MKGEELEHPCPQGGRPQCAGPQGRVLFSPRAWLCTYSRHSVNAGSWHEPRSRESQVPDHLLFLLPGWSMVELLPSSALKGMSLLWGRGRARVCLAISGRWLCLIAVSGLHRATWLLRQGPSRRTPGAGMLGERSCAGRERCLEKLLPKALQQVGLNRPSASSLQAKGCPASLPALGLLSSYPQVCSKKDGVTLSGPGAVK